MQLPVTDLLIDLLRIDAESGEYRFAEGANGAIDALLGAVLALDEPQPAIDELVRFACVLELELRSPAAASDLRAVLCSSPRFISALGGVPTWEGFGANPELAQWSGAQDVKQAPTLNASIPNGTLKAGSLVSVVPPHIAKAQARKRQQLRQRR